MIIKITLRRHRFFFFFVLHPLLLLLLLLTSFVVVVVNADSPYSSASSSTTTTTIPTNRNIKILVVGSANIDTFLQVERLPVEGENIMLLPNTYPSTNIPGGKGCTQAVAASKLLLQRSGTDSSGNTDSDTGVTFIGQLGNENDDNGNGDNGRCHNDVITNALKNAGVDTSYCQYHDNIPTGRGYVFLNSNSGQVSAVVSGGANIDGWKSDYEKEKLQKQLDKLLLDHDDDNDCNKCCVIVVMLQREIPEYVNEYIAMKCSKAAAAASRNKNNNKNKKIIVIQDIGGEDRPISRRMLQLCDYIAPNESELRRLVQSFIGTAATATATADDTNSNDDNDDKSIIRMARILQQNGARNVLVTRGSKGCILVREQQQQHGEPPQVLKQQAFPILSKDGVPVDETGAGDCFRAAFAVALAEQYQNNNSNSNKSLQKCLQFASAAGVCSVERHGAVPSTPTRQQVEERLKLYYLNRNRNQQQQQQQKHHSVVEESAVLKIPRGDGFHSSNTDNNDDVPRGGGASSEADNINSFPFLIGSRLNSMKDRPELWLNSGGDGEEEVPSPSDPSHYVRRQGLVRGLTCVDFNYPQHFHGSSWWTKSPDTAAANKILSEAARKARAALKAEGLVAGAVCLRYPSPEFVRGAMNHPNANVRENAIRLTKEAAQVALDLGCNEVVVWSAYDGYDYPFQVDYDTKWDELVNAFQECCDAFPTVKFSLEFKPTDENTRFFTVPSTGAALLLAQEVDRPNFGLTLDVGHMLMAGENPGQSIAMVGRSNKLFGIQLNDGYTRLAAEDGLMFGSVHPAMALEIMYQLRRTKFDGHLYFDTFPQRTDPVREAEYNIRRVKAYWNAACTIDLAQLQKIVDNHDAIGALELIEDSLRQM